jgi:hypothetical protein
MSTDPNRSPRTSHPHTNAPTSLQTSTNELGNRAQFLQILPFEKADIQATNSDDLAYVGDEARIRLWPMKIKEGTAANGTAVWAYMFSSRRLVQDYLFVAYFGINDTRERTEYTPEIIRREKVILEDAFPERCDGHMLGNLVKYYMLKAGVEVPFRLNLHGTFQDSLVCLCEYFFEIPQSGAVPSRAMRGKPADSSQTI